MQTCNDMLNLYSAINNSDDWTLFFHDARLPQQLDYKTLANTIIVQYGTCPVIVSETKQFKYMSDNFFDTWYDNIDRVVSALYAEYNPIENYDRQEEWNDTSNRNKNNTGTVTDKGSTNGTISKSGQDENKNKSGGSDVTTEKVSAYNSEDYANSNQSTLQHGKTDDTIIVYGSKDSNNQTIDNTRTDNLNENEENRNRHIGRVHGNVGVTTNQQMIVAEIDLRLKNNIYEMIAAEWADRLLLSTW